jgi:hypothetical protein
MKWSVRSYGFRDCLEFLIDCHGLFQHEDYFVMFYIDRTVTLPDYHIEIFHAHCTLLTHSCQFDIQFTNLKMGLSTF